MLVAMTERPPQNRAQDIVSAHDGKPLHHRGAHSLCQSLGRGEIGAVELTRHFISRIERLDDEVNAVVVRDFERALEAATRADARPADERGPLHGLPVTVKEAFDVAGLPTTWGVADARREATDDAVVVERLRRAGAVILGKTNVPAMLHDFQTENPIHGTTRNPYDLSCMVGGSSGGSAAALAAGFTGLECGSDLGGSVRNPAHYCGVYAHKPSWGVVPMRGHTYPGMRPTFDPLDMACAGPIARDSADLALALDVMAGPDGPGASGWRLRWPEARTTSLRGLRVAVWPNDPVSPVATEVADRVQDVADRLASAGAVVDDGARPDFSSVVSRRIYVALVQGLEGVLIDDAGYAAARERAEAMSGDATPEAFLAQTLVMNHRTWHHHHRQRVALREAWRDFFRDWDVLLCPIMATAAVPHDSSPIPQRRVMVDGEPQPILFQVFWASLASVARLPATVFPAGRSAAGLPIGLQLLGPEMEDRTPIAVAEMLSDVVGGYVPPPGF